MASGQFTPELDRYTQKDNMEQIIKNLQDPSWWFSGLFFVIIGLLLTKLFFNWLPILWRKTAKIIPKFNRRISRWKEKLILKRVRLYRQHEVKVNWLISRYWALATIVTIYIIFAAIVFVLSPNMLKEGKNKILPIALISPIYVFQILTIWERKILKRVIDAHIAWKKRITSRSS